MVDRERRPTICFCGRRSASTSDRATSGVSLPSERPKSPTFTVWNVRRNFLLKSNLRHRRVVGQYGIAAVVFGLPPRARDRHLQKSRNPARCQPTRVCGFATTRTSAQRDQTRRRPVQNNRSSGCNRGRGRFRLSTASCCRRARISIAVSSRVRKKTRTAARGTRMNSSTKSYVLPSATPPGPGSPSC